MCGRLHDNLVTVAGFRQADEAVVPPATATLFWTSSGERLRAEPYGGFLVNFLCKENWNVGARDAISKEVNVHLQFLN